MSLVETAELAVKASRRLAAKGGQRAIRQGAQIKPIGAEDSGEATTVAEAEILEAIEACPVGEDAVLVVEDLVDTVDKDRSILTHWHVIGAGCMAIWPVTVPAPLHSHRIWVLVMLAPPEGVRSNPGIHAQKEDVAMGDRFALGL